MTRARMNGHLLGMVAAVVLAALALALMRAEPAEAAFPGINGKLVFSKRATTRFPGSDEIIYHVQNPPLTGR